MEPVVVEENEQKVSEKVDVNAQIEQDIINECNAIDSVQATGQESKSGADSQDSTQDQKDKSWRIGAWLSELFVGGKNYSAASWITKDEDQDIKDEIHHLFKPSEMEREEYNLAISETINEYCPSLKDSINFDGDPKYFLRLFMLGKMEYSRIMDALKVVREMRKSRGVKNGD